MPRARYPNLAGDRDRCLSPIGEREAITRSRASAHLNQRFRSDIGGVFALASAVLRAWFVVGLFAATHGDFHFARLFLKYICSGTIV